MRLLLRTSTSTLLATLIATFLGCAGSEPAAVEEADPSHSEYSLLTGVAPRAFGGFPSVLMLTPEESSMGVSGPSALEPELMDQFGNAFHPELLVVRPGQKVEFRNSEDVAHNVHVIDQSTRETIFNVATPVVGAYVHTFETPGAFDVSCNMHSWMAAFIIVTDAPHVAIASKEGEFSLPSVPPGKYTVKVWNVDEARRSERTLEWNGSGSVSLVEETASPSSGS